MKSQSSGILDHLCVALSITNSLILTTYSPFYKSKEQVWVFAGGRWALLLCSKHYKAWYWPQMDFGHQSSELCRDKPNPVPGHKSQSLSLASVVVVGERPPCQRRLALYSTEVREVTTVSHVHRCLLSRDHCQQTTLQHDQGAHGTSFHFLHNVSINKRHYLWP